MDDAYERDISDIVYKEVDDNTERYLVLLGVRADADIDYRDKRIKKLQAENERLRVALEFLLDRASYFAGITDQCVFDVAEKALLQDKEKSDEGM